MNKETFLTAMSLMGFFVDDVQPEKSRVVFSRYGSEYKFALAWYRTFNESIGYEGLIISKNASVENHIPSDRIKNLVIKSPVKVDDHYIYRFDFLNNEFKI